MKHGFVKVAAASPSLRVADPVYNANKIIETIRAQAEKETEILVFPELCLSGYTCGDLFLQQTLLDGCLAARGPIGRATEGINMLVFVGLPFEVQSGKVYNCAAAVSGGEVKGLVPKSHLPNNGEFYERRYFMSAWEGESVLVKLPFSEKSVYIGTDIYFEDRAHGVCVACEICEDLWVPVSPSVKSAVTKANLIVNLSASSETAGKREYRHTLVSAQSGKCVCGYVYCDAGEEESTGDGVFAGNHMIYENGVLLAETKPFEGRVCEAEIDVGFLNAERRKLNTFHEGEENDYIGAECSFVGDGNLKLRHVISAPFLPEGEKERAERCELILNIQAHALKKRLAHTNAKTAVLGISGGLDSTLAFLVTARAFDLLGKDRKQITAITMPGFGTTGKTKNNAVALIGQMGACTRTVDITASVLQHFKDIGHDPENKNSAYENAQARMRTMILMDVANEEGGLVVGTGDLSELALGWCTYNGDHMSMYGVNASVPKTLVKALVAYEAKRLGGNAERILNDILDTEISPELLPPDDSGNIAQKTEDLVGPYELHDLFLYSFLRRGDAPAKTLYLAERAFDGKYSRAEIKKWLTVFYRRLFSQQFKRSCSPDGVKVGSVSLSPRADWRMPSDASPEAWLAETEKL